MIVLFSVLGLLVQSLVFLVTFLLPTYSYSQISNVFMEFAVTYTHIEYTVAAVVVAVIVFVSLPVCVISAVSKHNKSS